MTLLEFKNLCGRYYIDVFVAFENENIKQALADKDDQEVERILLEEF